MGGIDDLMPQSTIDEVKNTFDNKLEDQSTETEDDEPTTIHNSKLDQVITTETYAISDGDRLDKDIEHEKSDISDDIGVDSNLEKSELVDIKFIENKNCDMTRGRILFVY